MSIDPNKAILSTDLSRFETQKSFWGRVERNVNGCWIWAGWIGGKDARPTISVAGKLYLVHRIVWEAVHGRITENYCICHKYDNTRCIRPSHLWMGTRAENNKDRAKKGRSADTKGEKSHTAKLTWDDVSYIRSHFVGGKGGNYLALARQFKVDHTTIYHTVRNQQWVS